MNILTLIVETMEMIDDSAYAENPDNGAIPVVLAEEKTSFPLGPVQKYQKLLLEAIPYGGPVAKQVEMID